MLSKIRKFLRVRLWVLIVLITYLLIVLFAWFSKNETLYILVVIISAPLVTIAGLIWWAMIYKATQIRKVEFISAVIAIVFCGIIWRFLLKIPGGVALTGITFSLLSIFYFVFSFALFNGIGFRGIFKKSSYKNTNVLGIVSAYMIGMTLAIILIGIMFQLLLLPGAKGTLLIGLIVIVLITIITSILHSQNIINNFKSMLKRIVIYGGLGIALYLTPYNTIVDLAYTPRWAELRKRELADPFDLQVQEDRRLLEYQEGSIMVRRYVFLTQDEIDNFYQGDYFMLGDMKFGEHSRHSKMSSYDFEIIGSDIKQLSGLNSLKEIGSLYINKTSLANLKGLENLISVEDLRIIDNHLLIDCEIQWVCDLIAGSPESILIEGNAVECASPDQVKSSCSFKGNE